MNANSSISIFGILSGVVLFILIANAFLNARNIETKISEISANNIGLNLFGNFLLPFEILGLLLTAAVIGAIILVFKDKENTEKTNPKK
ncbi:MAG: NADH-quinone oxidoreductase subunit J [Candidatus Altarchaeum sp.]|nr:NADH-quinone oxidoreductase subunit J [Candidatus Altarchaeum sp.]